MMIAKSAFFAEAADKVNEVKFFLKQNGFQPEILIGDQEK